MIRRTLRNLALGATVTLLGAAPAGAGALEIPMGPVSAQAAPVRLAAADTVGRMVFSRQWRPTAEDALPGRISIFEDEKLLSLEDWLREWGTVQIHQIGRPF